MGMSANQARLLTLTARQHDLELRAQQISATKMTLSLQSQQWASKYAKALNDYSSQQTLADGHFEYTEVPVSQEWLTQNGYVIYNFATAKEYTGTDIETALKNGWDVAKFIPEQAAGSTQPSTSTGKLSDYPVDTIMANFVKAANQNGYPYGTLTVTDLRMYDLYYIEALTDNGNGTYTMYDNGKLGCSITVTYDQLTTGLTTPQPAAPSEPIPAHYVKITNRPSPIGTWVPNDNGNAGSVDLETAKAEYATAMAALSSQEKILDMELTQIDTEHKAVKTEYDAVKSLIGDNVEKSFNIFG